jgi:hypothetical protein
MFQCFVSHDGPEIRTTDTDVDHVANALACAALPCTTPRAVGEIGHLIKNSMDLRHYVLAINDDRCLFRCAKNHMQNGAIFRDVDLVTSKHRVNPLTQARLVCELHE